MKEAAAVFAAAERELFFWTVVTSAGEGTDTAADEDD